MKNEDYINICIAIDTLAWEMYQQGFDKGYNGMEYDEFMNLTRITRLACQNEILVTLLIKECSKCESS